MHRTGQALRRPVAGSDRRAATRPGADRRSRRSRSRIASRAAAVRLRGSGRRRSIDVSTTRRRATSDGSAKQGAFRPIIQALPGRAEQGRKVGDTALDP